MEWTIYVDLDAFYVACELRERPELRDAPVLVGPDPSKGPTRGVVLSASYAARAFGARSAMPVARAAELVPGAVWIRPDHAKYSELSRRVFELLRSRAPRVAPLSIDEGAIPIEAPDAAAARRFAEEIQAALDRELGLSSSIGVAPHRTVAKIASDRQKPHGITVVAPEEVREFLAPLPPRVIPGIGPKTSARLDAAGLRTIRELEALGRNRLRPLLGGFTDEVLALARGEPRPVSWEDSGPHLRSTDRTFAVDVVDLAELERALDGMVDGLFEAVRSEGLRAGAVGVAVRWSDFTRTQHGRRLAHGLDAAEQLRAESRRLLRALWEGEPSTRRRAVRTLSLRLERLRPARGRQRRLLEAPGEPALN